VVKNEISWLLVLYTVERVVPDFISFTTVAKPETSLNDKLDLAMHDAVYCSLLIDWKKQPGYSVQS